MVDQNSLIRVVESALELKEGTIDIASSSDNTENWDSLNQINILVAIEEEYDIYLSSEEMSKMTSFSTILEIVNKKFS